jgi:ectoine hydroxylase-related dioxygenase (phytanoyl-CoA dioxygenase family)
VSTAFGPRPRGRPRPAPRPEGAVTELEGVPERYRSGVIRRLRKNLSVLDPTQAPAASEQLERDGYAVLAQVFSPDEVAQLVAEIDAVFESFPAERGRGDKAEFRYQMLNRSAACQAAVMHPSILEVIEPLLGEDCHVIANTAWRNPPSFTGGPWHCDAGPHVPRPEDVPWDDRIPYPVFAIGAHVMLQDCRRLDGPTAIVPGSHRSGRLAPFDRMFDETLSYDGRPPVLVEVDAGDVALFVSDAWHRGLPAGERGRGRYFLQVHYGRRDIAQRIRTTAEVNHLTPEAIERATTDRARTIAGLHDPFFYDG